MTVQSAAVGYTPFQDSNDIRSDSEALRARMKEDGYLFFRGLVPPEPVLQVRRETLELCQEVGWMDPRRDLMEGMVRSDLPPSTEGKPEYMPVYKKMLHLQSFSELPSHPALVDVAWRQLGGEVLVHPRRIGRMVFPHNVGATTPPHQDHFYIRGAVETYSCWMPLGDCPQVLGGLAVLRGSHEAGFVEHHVFTPGAVGGRGVDPEGDFGHLTHDWRTSDFGVGDALFFHSHTVHKALPNLTEDRLRLSTDNRYQRKNDDIHPSSLGSHFDL